MITGKRNTLRSGIMKIHGAAGIVPSYLDCNMCGKMNLKKELCFSFFWSQRLIGAAAVGAFHG